MTNVIKTLTKEDFLLQYIGLEREGLRCDENGNLVKSKHPESFGCKLTNPYITTDFSESQLELITPVLTSAEGAYDFLENLYNIAALEIGNEYIWPQSMPCTLEDDIPIAKFCDDEKGQAAYCYRQSLLKKYGGKRQVISGIHYNFSFNEKLIRTLYQTSQNKSYKFFRNKCYLKVARNYLRYRWLIIYLLGGSSIVHKSYDPDCLNELENEYMDSKSSRGALSYRNSECGYVNKNDLYPDYTNIKSYVSSIEEFIKSGQLESVKELYTQVRIKAHNNDDMLRSLRKDGVNYLEFRSIDINPFDKVGIKKIDLKFLSLFNLFLLLKKEVDYPDFQKESSINQFRVAKYGFLNPELSKNGQDIKMDKWANQVLGEIILLNNLFHLGQNHAIEYQKQKVEDHKNTYAHRIFSKVKEEGFIKAHMDLAKVYKADAYKDRYTLKGYENLELSTVALVKESIKRGVKVEILDPIENFIRLEQNNHVEYVKQATKTSKDSYISMLIMENKLITKHVLREHDINTPVGEEVLPFTDRNSLFKRYKNKAIVVKPKSTNFGLGISIFKEPTFLFTFQEALDIAFQYDKTVLVEEFIPGQEYRFVVIGDKVVGILKRVPANVTGDGSSSITELVAKKNEDPLRGTGHQKPLETIILDEPCRLFLEQQGLNFDSIPAKEETIYLRENSNISTGGDSIDFTDDVADYFKEIAISAAKCVGANICGVDMIIEDISGENPKYSIIELNFNPAIHIHHYPYKGKSRNISGAVLDLLGYPTQS
ncbi:MAG: bifunctional glutamate--cysteine ligase/glutathione synthetase [Candidatus Epulonipiscioides saccharophilum]|nr:MAG: bifunctional glutamate--cysteine ligase/glutathione synthetase [Epulopiscium sp. AS2M-Bin001]